MEPGSIFDASMPFMEYMITDIKNVPPEENEITYYCFLLKVLRKFPQWWTKVIWDRGWYIVGNSLPNTKSIEALI